MENSNEQKTSCCTDGKCKMRCAKHAAMGLLALVLIVYVGVLTRNALRTYDYIGKTPDIQNQITVTGTAKVSATPDVALISLGIVSEGTTVNEAQKGTTEKMNSIVNTLKSQFKIDPKDIKTDNFSVYPKYNYSNGKQNIIGYSVNQSVSVKVRNFDQTGDILAKATELGANSVSGPNFSIDDLEKVKAEARTKAIAQAKEKAKLLADQVGIKLGRIVNFYEGGNELANIGYGIGGSPELSMDSVAKAAPVIEAGSQDVQLTVSLSYEIR